MGNHPTSDRLLEDTERRHASAPTDSEDFWHHCWPGIARSIPEHDHADLISILERWYPRSVHEATNVSADDSTPKHRRRRRHPVPDLLLPEGFRVPDDAEPYVQQQHIRLLFRDPVTRKKRWIWLHRYIWEWANGPLSGKMLVHHVNGDPTDNRLENLQAMTRAGHSRLHRLNPHLRNPEAAQHYAKNKAKNQKYCSAYYQRKKARKAELITEQASAAAVVANG